MRFASKIATVIKACLIITLMMQQVAVGAGIAPMGVAGKSCSNSMESVEAERAITVCSGCGCCEIDEADQYCSCCSEKEKPQPREASCCSAGDVEEKEGSAAESRSKPKTLLEASNGETHGCTCVRNRAPTQPSKTPSSQRSIRDQLVRQPDAIDSRAVLAQSERHSYPVAPPISLSKFCCAQRALCIWQL